MGIIIKKTSSILGMLTLLSSAASMAASVEVIPSTGITSPCCDATIPFPPASNFYVTLHAVDFPGNGSTTGVAGTTLTINFNPAVVNLIGAESIAGSPLVVSRGSPTPNGPGSVIITAVRTSFGPTPAYAFGTFNAFQVNFTTIANGNANIFVVDDGFDNSWTDQAANPIPNVTYTQANVTVGAVPVPAGVWLLGSALGVLGWMRRRAAA